MEELKRTIAYIFERMGEEAMPERDFRLQASMDLGWFSPAEAQKLLETALDIRLLESKEGIIRPTFDVEGVAVPLGFRPTKRVLSLSDTDPLFLRMVEDIKETTGMEQAKVIAAVNAKKESLGIEMEVACALVGAELGVDLRRYYRQIEGEIVARLGA